MHTDSLCFRVITNHLAIKYTRLNGRFEAVSNVRNEISLEPICAISLSVFIAAEEMETVK
jgi:hypothetical protein